MNIESKINKLMILSIVLNIVLFICSSSKLISFSVLVLGIVILVAYSISCKSKIKKYLELEKQVNNNVSKIYASYQRVQSKVNNISNANDCEKEKLSCMTDVLESTSGKVIRNKENTRQASQLATNATEAATKGMTEMVEMLSSINEIKDLSTEIKKIIKVIDDIAFQTNILALNAAVEAARAGDAGKGFAVVADEVKNLAQKSAEAVKDTRSIIEKNISSAEVSVSVSEKVSHSLEDINDEIRKVSELINEIAASSEEQADEVISTQSYLKEVNKLTHEISVIKADYEKCDNDTVKEFEETINYVNEFNFESDNFHEYFYNDESTSLNIESKKEDKTKTTDDKIEIKRERFVLDEKSEETKIVSPKRSFEKIEKVEKQPSEQLKRIDDIASQSISFALDDSEEKELSEAEKILPLDDNDGF